MTPLVLGCLAVLLAGPVPSLMSRWHALRHTPVAAMLLWQSVAMAAVLSAVGAGLSLTTAKAWRNNGTILEYAVATVALSSEEPTSELQALMRNSYAVLCL